MADKNSKTRHRPETVKKVMSVLGIKKSKDSDESAKGQDKEMTEVVSVHKQELAMQSDSSMSPVDTSPEKECTLGYSTDDIELCNVGSCTLVKQQKDEEIQRLLSECERNQDEIRRLKEECVRYQKFNDQVNKAAEALANEKLMNEQRKHEQELESLRKRHEDECAKQDKERQELIEKQRNIPCQELATNSFEYEQKLKELGDLKRQLKRMEEQQTGALDKVYTELAEREMRCETLKKKVDTLTEENEKLQDKNQKEIDCARIELQNKAENDKAEVVQQLTDQLEEMKNKVSSLEKQLLEREDPTAVETQQKEYEKAKEDMAAERRHWRRVEEHKTELLAEIEKVKQELADFQASEEMVDQLKQQLQDKEEENHRLVIACKSPLVTDVAIQSEPDEEKTQLSQTVEDLTKSVKNYQHKLRTAHALEETVAKTMQTLKIKFEIQLNEEREKCDELQRMYQERESRFTLEKDKLKAVIQEKKTVIQDLNKRLCTLNMEFDVAKHDLETKNSELSTLTSELSTSTHEKEHQKQKMLKLEENIGVAQSQIAINTEEMKKTMEEEKKAKDSITLTKKELMKAGVKSVEELRKSYEVMKERLQQKTEEDVSTAQQVKAYKRQLDDSNEKLTNMKEKMKKLQERLNEMDGIERKYNESQAELHDLRTSWDSSQTKLQILSEENKKITNGQQFMKRKIEELEQKCQKHQQAELRIRQLTQGNIELENRAKALNELLEESYAKYDALINNHPYQSTNHPDQSNVIPHQPNDHYSDRITNKADRRLKEAEEARQQYEQKRHTSQINYTPQQQMTNRTSHTYQEMTGHSSHTPQQMSGLTNHPNAQQRIFGGINYASQQQTVGHTNHTPYLQVVPHEQVNDIHENPIIENIDDEIQHYANEVRRDTQPPRTQEFTSNDGQGIPYDPNLTCDGCGKQFRYGEIQKLRRHIHEFCIAREQT